MTRRASFPSFRNPPLPRDSPSLPIVLAPISVGASPPVRQPGTLPTVSSAAGSFAGLLKPPPRTTLLCSAKISAVSARPTMVRSLLTPRISAWSVTMNRQRDRQPMQFEAAFPAVQERAAEFARQMGPHAAKRLQAELDIEAWTAERVLMKRASLPVILRMIAAYGWRCASFVLEPVCGQVDRLELAHRLEATERLAREALQEANDLRQEITAQVGGLSQPPRGERDPVRHVVPEGRPKSDALVRERGRR